MQNESALRAITARLTVTPSEHLPRIAGFLATALAQCPLEDQFADNKTNASSVTAHKLKTRITSLLQERNAAGRLTAAVLIKTIVDKGGANVLANSEVWVKGLLSCLNKPDPVEGKRIYLAAIIRIFLLTQNYPTLLREVTTPLLPPFVTACLGLIRPVKAQVAGNPSEVANPLLNSVLQAYNQLLPHHPTTFRPFVARLKLVCQSLLEDSSTPAATRELAIKLMCLLISCAPKNTASHEWTQTAASVIISAQATADKLFRAVIEEFEPNDTSHQGTLGKHNFSKEPRISDKDQLGLDSWTGIYDGSTRLVTLVDWLSNLISTPMPQAVAVPLGSILDLTWRLLAVAPPERKSNAATTLRYHSEASREEKEQLWLNLPQIHLSCLRLLQKMNGIYGPSLLAVDGAMLNQILEAFEAMSWHGPVRQLVYTIFNGALASLDLTEMKLNHNRFLFLIEQCCNDLKSCMPPLSDAARSNVTKDGFLSTGIVPTTNYLSLQRQSKLYQAAWELLPQIITHCPASAISRPSRIEMDRLSILLDHTDAMLASVMRPILSDKGKVMTASLTPFLARSAVDVIAVEALLRPRMSVAQTTAFPAGASEDDNPEAIHEQHEEQGDDDRDMSSNPEDSHDALDSPFGTKERVPNDTSGLAENANNEETQISTTKKRTLDDIRGSHAGSSPTDSQTPSSRELKIPRLDEKRTRRSSFARSRETDTHTEPPRTSTFAEVIDLASTPKEALLPETTSKTVVPIDGSDSDDSEIPEIVLGFDTDEEESE
jgi:pre-rRNA-processing protein RIX1